jgi:HSP20 family molecular chaperone IbpA
MNQFPYNEGTETMMKRLFNNLSEKDRRHYASVEAAKLEHGGMEYISELFGIDRKTIRVGIEELKKTTFAGQSESEEKEAAEKRTTRKRTRESSKNSKE